jgi:2-amino-4-hydroxy-6-hydroxymethyldihydropteridine diphosphokinase
VDELAADAVGSARLAVVALGSNLGNRREALDFAISRLAPLLAGLVVSDAVETDPEGEGLEDQPLFLNAVAVGETPLTARDLLDAILAIETEFGRERPSPNAPRTLDLDLILLGSEVIEEPTLHLPHPRFRDRFFVLGPLSEIAPDIVDPVTGRRVVDLLRALLEKR